MTIRKLLSYRVNDTTPDDHLGHFGEITYRDGFLYFHDGVTPGGEIIGGGGSGGTAGSIGSGCYCANGGAYGGGAGSPISGPTYGTGAVGAVRIIWGANRSYPSTNTGNY